MRPMSTARSKRRGRAFEAGSWSGMAPRQRKKILLRFADLIEQNVTELAVMETQDCGKPITDSLTVDLPDTIETLRWHAEAIDKIYDQIPPTQRDVVSMIVREPIGVVGAVLPWNFPLFVAMWKIAPALAGGNSLIVKPAEQTPLTALRLAALAAEAGIPVGVFNVVPGFGKRQVSASAATWISTASASPAPVRSAVTSSNTPPSPI